MMLATIAVLITAIACSVVSWFSFSAQVQEDLKDYGQIITAGYNSKDNVAPLSDYNTEKYRITFIDNSGKIIYESNEALNKEEMGNHLNRPEITDAINHGAGSSYRVSDSLGTVTYYYALRTDDGNVVRVSKEVDPLLNSFLEIIPVILVILVLILLSSMLMASRSTKRIVKPIENMTQDINDIAYEELIPFSTTIKNQQSQIKQQMKKVQLEKDKINALIDNMSEGFLLLDMDKTILTSNESIYNMLKYNAEKLEGKNIIELSRDLNFLECVNNAINGNNSTIKFTLNNSDLQVIASPVFSNEVQKGVICLIMNITEKEKAEKMRREFTANVSHELKTPLTSISGYAEMIENGMVTKDEDIKRFAGKIHKEAGRLITLIIDIIDLSQLDEPKRNIEKQYVKLNYLVDECFDALTEKAHKNNIKLSYDGEECTLLCNRSMIYEVIYNLCDNAIRYNKINGEVTVSITESNQNITIKVKDTGIGIPKNHQPRIFERFYRVDKSHSKETGGTGLGLAIVKHIVEQHKGNITLNSVENKYTEIVIVLPK